MSDERPAPPVPAEVDLRDFAFMPLDVLRLRDSDLACVEDAEVFRCAVLSWCVSWHQVPAASLPDDDALLARLLGFGRDVKGWKRVRAAGGMRGWFLCQDGRLYHSVVAEKAREAWDGKLQQRWRTEAARVKKHNQRHGLEGSAAVQMSEFSEWKAAGCPQGQTLHVPGTQPPCPDGPPEHVPRETASKGQGEGQGQGQGLEGIPSLLTQAPAPLPQSGPQLALVEADPRPERRKVPDCPHRAILALWAEVLPAMPQHNPELWAGARADHLRARWRETAALKGWQTEADGLAYLRRLFAYCGQSAFLTGRAKPSQQGQRPFLIELEWLVSPGNWAKVIEGKYHTEAAA